MKHTFVLSDETVNSQGFAVLTSGIELDDFLKNPILLYQHDRERGVIGRWENVRIEGNKLLGEPVFDESDELGKAIKSKVDGGFLRATSIGIKALQLEMINGVKTATSSVLLECSIVDIPANKNAVKLFQTSEKYTYSLAEYEGSDDNTILRGVLDFLALPYPSGQNDVLDALKNLKKDMTDEQKEVQVALRNEIITKDDADEFLKLSDDAQKVFLKFVRNESEKLELSVEDELINARNKGKIYQPDIEKLRKFHQVYGISALKELLSYLPEKAVLAELINQPPEEPIHDLDYYRKNDPAFLKDNPQEYERLITIKYGDDGI